MGFLISFIAAVIIFGLLMLVLTLKTYRDVKKSITSARGHGAVCQCRLARHTIQVVQAKDKPVQQADIH
jgi:isocitrate dehydrogenase kinase/phosphatase